MHATACQCNCVIVWCCISVCCCMSDAASCAIASLYDHRPASNSLEPPCDALHTRLPVGIELAATNSTQHHATATLCPGEGHRLVWFKHLVCAELEQSCTGSWERGTLRLLLQLFCRLGARGSPGLLASLVQDSSAPPVVGAVNENFRGTSSILVVQRTNAGLTTLRRNECWKSVA